MSTFTDDELIDYVLGRVPPERARAIDERARCDAGLAAQLGVMAALGGVPPLEPPPGALRALLLVRWVRWTAAALVLVTVAAAGAAVGAAWASRKVQEPPTAYLADDFDDGQLNARLWRSGRLGQGGGWVLEEAGGHLRLFDRGSLVTADEFGGPISVRFKWRWLDLGTDPIYREGLTIALRTTGRHQAGQPWEIEDGFSVFLNAHRGCIYLVDLAPALPGGVEPVKSAEGLTPFPAGAWHDVRITDDGQVVRVYLSGPAIDPKYATTPVLESRRTHPALAHHVAVYNRERVGQTDHESHLDNFRIDVLRPDE